MPSDQPPDFEAFRHKVHLAKLNRHFDPIISKLISDRNGIKSAAITDEIRREVNPRLVMALWNVRTAQT